MNEKAHGVYGEKEMKYMMAFQAFKGRILRPLVVLLNKMRVTPNMLSILGVIFVLGGLFWSFWSDDDGAGIYFVIGIWAHMLLDGIDGTLARYNEQISNETRNEMRDGARKKIFNGEILDISCDFIGVVTASIFLWWLSFELWILVAYTILYGLMTIFAYVLGKRGKPYEFVLRPRIYVYAALTVDFIWNTKINSWLLYILSAILLFFVVQGGLKMRKN